MAANDNDKKYSKSSGQHCGVKDCTNNRKKLHIWSNEFCDLHNVVHEQCPCQPPFSLHRLPRDADKQRQWYAAVNRRDPPKYLMVCSVHFLDGKPTDQNPIPSVHLGYERTVTPGRRKLVRAPLNVTVTNSKARKCILTEASDVPVNSGMFILL
jgi:hypothetical protein